MDEREGTNGTVFIDRGRLYTRSFDPGRRVYSERLVNVGGIEYREWNPSRSKLSAYLSVGGQAYPLKNYLCNIYCTFRYISSLKLNPVYL